MPQIYPEGYLEFHFADDWNVIKFDEHPEYQKLAQTNGSQQLPGIKGVDFVGILHNTLYFIEVKDFRGHRIENRPRLEGGTLAVELGQKVHSSIACLVGFHRTSSTPEIWKPFVRLLSDPTKLVKVVLWLENELPSHPKGQRKARFSTYLSNFKPRLRWITSCVIISNQETNSLDEVQVHNLPHATV